MGMYLNFDFLNISEYKPIEFNFYTAGNLTTGVYQYSYRLLLLGHHPLSFVPAALSFAGR